MANNALHTFIALRDGSKNRKTDRLTQAHRTSERSELYDGHTRTYRPKNDDGDQLPPENKNIQINADTMLNELANAVQHEWNLTATIDVGNQTARADVVVPSTDGKTEQVILRDVPATFLLFLARELDNVYTFVKKMPTLNPSYKWTYDESVAAYVAEPEDTHRTKKVLQNHVKYPHTERHPAQVETFTEDVVVGYWTTARRSGALTLERKALLLQRIDTLRLAVKAARERANQVVVDDVIVARPVFDYLFGGNQ